MLLVFFLVTSSMDSDKGLGRKLAPLDDQQQEMRDVHRSDVLQIRLDEHDSLFVDDHAVTYAELSQQVESFVASRQTDRHIIAVQADRRTSYDAYFEMQNAVVAAYHALREKMARQQYGHSLEQCSREELDAIVQRYPQRISEGMPQEGRESEKGGAR